MNGDEAATCEFDPCDRPRKVKGLCKQHYQQQWRGKELAPIRPMEWQANPVCSFDPCSLPTASKGLCSQHYNQRRKGQELRAIRRNPETWGSGWINRQGYRVLSRPGHPAATAKGKALEHRLVMSERLGRALEPHETVHHINGNKLDNRLENLELWSSSHPSGQRAVDKVRWARQILALYGDFFDTEGE